tara:strand:+ start:3354 stop:3854 length:501 start_codon:yes stop_codon:yes gene_type:complete
MAKVYWLTGLSGAGKTPLAKKLQRKLSKTEPTVLVDGDSVREIFGLDNYNDIKSRVRIAYMYSNLTNLIQLQGVNVVCATISLFHEIHKYNRRIFKNYCEIYVKKDLNKLIDEDKNKIYSKALKNETQVVGINIKPEYPENPKLIVDFNKKKNIDDIVNEIINIKI